MKRVMFVAVILTFFSAGVYAQKYNPNFDQGLNPTEFLKAAQEKNFPQPYVPYPKIAGDIIKSFNPSKGAPLNTDKVFSKPAAGYFYGPYHPRILNSQVYKNGQIYPPLLKQHENPTAYRLLANWGDVETVRGSLLAAAYALNPVDSTLYSEVAAANQHAVELRQEVDKYNAAVEAYKKDCPNGPVNEKCLATYNNLIKWHDRLEKDIADHNANIKRSEQRYADLTYHKVDLAQRILDWEADITNFIKNAIAFLSNPNQDACKPCPEPPAPVIDYVPPSTPHFPCKGTHMHYFVYHQSPPPECICRLVRLLKCLDKSTGTSSCDKN